jgi:Vitamin K-dependent gamma-carboxylase
MITATRNYVSEAWGAWNEFWFTPTNPATLSMIRVLAGTMLFYTHLVWSFDLVGFFGQNGWLPSQFMHQIALMTNDNVQRVNWTYFDFIQSHSVLWAAHIGALVVFFFLAIGFFSRTMSVLAFLIAVSYANRITPGAYFGLDSVNCMLALYLMLGPCGARYSLDRVWRIRRGGPTDVPPSISANLAVRLIQLHMCIIYLFSALGKLQGTSWWTGDAMWLSSANLEYQYMIDLTRLANYPRFMHFLTHLTVFWELTYCVLIWPRLTRPWVLLLAIFVHVGIAVAYGMPTFGLVMLIGNLAFVSPQTIRAWSDPITGRLGALLGAGGNRRAGQGKAAAA